MYKYRSPFGPAGRIDVREFMVRYGVRCDKCGAGPYSNKLKGQRCKKIYNGKRCSGILT